MSSKAKDLVYRRSQLTAVGGLLIVAALFLPRFLGGYAAEMSDGVARSLVFISTDIFRAGFLVGLGLVVIGRLRTRKWKLEAKKKLAEDC